MKERRINNNRIGASLYENWRGEPEVNIGNDCENVTFTREEAEKLIVLLCDLLDLEYWIVGLMAREEP